MSLSFTAVPDDKVCKRILIMMSNTGGGHRASAEAIKAAFQEKYGDSYEVSQGADWIGRNSGQSCTS